MESDERLTLTVKETQVILGLSRSAVYQAIETGEIPSVRIGKRILISKAALYRLLETNDNEK